MITFCTLFDSNYLTRFVALYQSLRRHVKDFQLYAFCFDSLSYDILTKLSLPYLKLVTLKEFETPALLTAKPTRSLAEYCWTCTPHTILHTLKDSNAASCTYLDADIYFFSSPDILLKEWS